MTQPRSKKSEPLLALVALLALGIVFGWLWLAMPHSTEDRSAEATAPVTAAESEPSPQPSATISHRTPSTPTEPARPVAAAPKPQPAESAAPPATEVAATARAPIPPDTRGFIDAIQGRYEEDTRDRDAGSVESALQTFFRSTKLPASALRSILCKQSVCKLEMYWRPEYDAAYRSALDELAAGNAKLVATRAEEPDKNGGVSLDAYWLRTLGNLPEPAQR